ncbi:SH3 domain-containing protein [Alterisphingorhabdus coralli]|uniref:SH3 domain-containing protein n=1 Tax=Alterisphingorhabdus coralli TaxID=3071408 RepID=A0AA97F9B0_9SPHN|nr:SH3 domain-containing protein [Parasphingorhabdus sp. SCSIO 66989]WOE76276.1 SH3 domain-containing protein [Parasphingorhabdus sp. SCSIO 66989]
MLALLCLTLGLTIPSTAAAQSSETPYWASIDQDVARTRTGPSTEYKIMWVYQRKNLPVKVIKRYQAWRQIEDPDGTQGWMHSRLLTRTRTAMVIGEIRPMRNAPSSEAEIAWRLEPGVVGKLGECTESGWCGFDVNGRTGFVRAEHVFGAGEP